MKWAYYNEIDPFAAQWLRNLMAAGHIPQGEVDERSIEDVAPSDLRQFRQCHFFAGIGGWAYAARLAGWPDDRELWTGSPPCQPFSVAGKGKAQADDRHLWPHYFRLASARRPAVLMGEQVAAAVGKDWLDGVFADLESIGYACGAAVVPACAVNAPHRRDRLWFVADAHGVYGERGQGGGRGLRPAEAGEGADHHAGGRCAIDGSGAMADADGAGLRAGGRGRLHCERQAGPFAAQHDQGAVGHAHGLLEAAQRGVAAQHQPDAGRVRPFAEQGAGASGGSDVAHPADQRCAGERVLLREDEAGRDAGRVPEAARRGAGGFWDAASWLIGHDGKARRVEPSIPLLAHGVPGRVGRLRAYGNAIVPQVAAEVIAAYMEAAA